LEGSEGFEGVGVVYYGESKGFRVTRVSRVLRMQGLSESEVMMTKDNYTTLSCLSAPHAMHISYSAAKIALNS